MLGLGICHAQLRFRVPFRVRSLRVRVRVRVRYMPCTAEVLMACT